MAIVPPRHFSEIAVPTVQSEVPFYLAFIIENKVEFILGCSEFLKSLFLSNPTIIQIEKVKDGGPKDGYIYNLENNTFTSPVSDSETPTTEISEENYLPYRLGFIVDNILETTMYLDERAASVLLNNPTIKEVDIQPSGSPEVGWMYNSETNTFYKE